MTHQYRVRILTVCTNMIVIPYILDEAVPFETVPRRPTRATSPAQHYTSFSLYTSIFRSTNS